MARASDETELQQQRAIARLAEVYAGRAPFAEDRACAAELAREAGPILDALMHARPRGAPDDPQALEHHEALAMITLLGRRAGTLGITPTAALALVPALREALALVGFEPSAAFVAALETLAMEGYVAAREERLASAASVRAASAIGTLRLAPKCLALILSGTQDAEALREVVERFGRALFEADARACIVDLGALREPTPELAVEVFAADVDARMLGARCFFSGASPAWIAAARAARVPLELLALEPTFESALPRALELAGLSLKRSGGLRALFRR